MPLFNPAVTPAGSTTQVQYNNAGAFGASSLFTYDSGTNTLGTGHITGTALGMTIQPKIPSVLEAGLALNLKTPNASKANTASGGIDIRTGTGLGNGVGGSLQIATGDGGVSGSGGYLNLVSGSGVYGGAFGMYGGTGYAGVGGGFQLFGGDSDTSFGGSFYAKGGLNTATGADGGTLELSGGSNSGTGGTFLLYGGIGGYGVRGGNVIIQAGACGDGTVAGGSLTLWSALSTVIEIKDDVSASLLGFYAVTPVVRQTTAIATITRTAVAGGNAVDDNDTFGGYTIGQIVTALKAYGLLA